ncbi:MarR family transcriptional regulator [Microbacterium sp. X-17]|uniref:MarR family winged helix-turn-helix transcriptional regulator n=1 Tax=Microbacterium sp. X-17 TaxID=3144404 RepID=UPI0031F59405
MRARHVRAEELADVTASAVSQWHPEVNELPLRLAFNLKRAATALTQREESAFSGATNRSVAAVRALTMIWMFEPVEARDIAELSGFSRQAISGVLTTLERDGLISRERAVGADRRLAPVSITEAGRDLLGEVLPRQNLVDEDFFSVLDDDERQQLVALIGKVMAAQLADPEPDGDDPSEE